MSFPGTQISAVFDGQRGTWIKLDYNDRMDLEVIDLLIDGWVNLETGYIAQFFDLKEIIYENS